MSKLNTIAAALALLAPLAAFAAEGDGLGSPPNNSTPPEKIEKPIPSPAGAGTASSGAQQGVATMPGGNLSEKLDHSNGVIAPKGDVDPRIEKPAPAAGSMPVLPPPAGPGSPSGDVAK